jgi:integrase
LIRSSEMWMVIGGGAVGTRRGKNEGSIHKRSDGRWCASVDLGWTAGKRLRRYLYGKTRKEVLDKLQTLQREQMLGVDIAPHQQTVQQFLENWLEQTVKRHNRPRTYDKYKDDVAHYILPHIGKLQLTKLTPDHVQRMLNEAANKGLSPRSVSNVRGVLRRALNQALRFGYVTRNVATLVDAPRTTTFTIQTLDEEQARQLLAAVAGHRLEALYRVALALGLRRGEVCGLLWSDVDFENERIKITGMLQRQNGKLERTPTKTKASTATLALPPVLLRALRQHQERQDQERAEAEGWEETGYVFVSERGTPLEPRNLNRHFKSVLKKIGLPETIRFHDLRHSCASLLIAQGEDLTVVKDILRHSQISVTADYYVHILEKTQRRAIEGLDTLLGDGAVLELPPRKVRKEEK